MPCLAQTCRLSSSWPAGVFPPAGLDISGSKILGGHSGRLRVGCIGVVALMWMVWTYERNAVWQDEVTLWRDCVAKAPNKGRALLNLSLALTRQGNVTEAVHYYNTALRVSAASVETHTL